jgi:short subunit dehydrogenase-like uncharacterized protein
MLALVDDQVVVRRAGRRVQFPVGFLRRHFDFGDGAVPCTAISGAEVLCSFLTTGIGDLEVYGPANVPQLMLYRLCGQAAPWLKSAPAQAFFSAALGLRRGFPTPSGAQVAVAVATQEDGTSVALRLVVRDVDSATVTLALGAVERVLALPDVFGFQTPGRLLGARFLQALPCEVARVQDPG